LYVPASPAPIDKNHETRGSEEEEEWRMGEVVMEHHFWVFNPGYWKDFQN
jgi:hypothetical protein